MIKAQNWLLLPTALLAGIFSARALLAAPPDAPPSAAARVAGRGFPSIFQAWNPADNLQPEDTWTTVARHDLLFCAPDYLGLHWEGDFPGLATGFTAESLPRARALRQSLLSKNPHMIILAELRYRDAPVSYLPQEHAWWRLSNGQSVVGWEEGGYLELDLANRALQSQVATQAQAVMASGVFDGILLDWWQDDDDRLALIQTIRQAIGDDPLILANANDRQTPRTAGYLNGYFMECYQSQTDHDWQQIAATLTWAESHLREPRINCLETWFDQSRRDLPRMRATTTLSLTLSDGYCLFSDPNPLPTADHLHDWYPFWNKSLGRPQAPGIHLPDGSYQRPFEHGLAVYNPPGNPAVTVEFAQPRTSQACRQRATKFAVPPGDGDLFLQD